MPNDTDVFISYAHADQEWVRVLAENLHQSGLNVFYDEWEIGAGDVLVHKLDAGILNTRNGVVVVSPTSLTRPWVQEEYAAMLTRAVAGKQRLIPVLLKDAELPPFMASRVWVDFRHADGPVYLQRVEELVRALKGERRGPPPRTGTLKPPPGTGFRAEGKTSACLRIGDGEAKLSGGESGEVREPIAGVDDRLRELLWEQQRALRRAGTAALRDAGRDGVEPVLEPPIKEPESFPEAITILQSLSLLAPVQYTDDNIPHYVVHRWTARALAQRASGKQLADAHRCAAGYWRWRVQVQPQSRGQAIEDLLEARYHHYEAGDMNEAIAVTHYICSHLHTWGAWQREERLCREALAWIPDRSIDAADFLHELGAIAHRRGDYDRALDHYRNALKIRDALGDRRGMAGSYHQLGIVAQERGEYDRALESYRKSLGILKALGDRPGMADCYHQLGNVMYLRGDYAGALDHYRNALKIRDALGDRPGAADSYQALGMIAHDQGDYDRALGWYHDALKIRDALGDRPGTASCYHELGMVAHRRKDYDRALGWYRKSLDIFEELGVRTNVAVSYHALGMVAQDRGDYDRALDWYHKSLEIKKAIGDRHGMARTISQIGVLYTERGEAAAAVPYNLRSLAIRLKISAAEARIDLRWLSRQREALAAERFRHVLSEHLSEADAARVIELLDE